MPMKDVGPRQRGRRTASSERRRGASPWCRSSTCQDITNNTVPEAIRQSIRKTGCAVVRGVFRADLARLVRGSRRVPRDEPLRTTRGREAEPRQVFLGAEGRQAANLQRLLVEAAGDGAAGREARRDARVSRSPVEIRRRLQSRPAVHLCRPRAPAAARRQDARPFAAHGRGHRRALDRPGYQRVYENIFAGDWRGL